MPDTNEALAIAEQHEITEAELKEFFYAVRGLKRRSYSHVNMPTTKDVNGPKVTNHRCMICKHNALGDAEIDHQKSCSLFLVQQLWKELKAKRPDLFDFTDRFPKSEPLQNLESS